jgi:flagellar M-ring protein FliF
MVPTDKVHLMRMQLAAKGIPRGDGVGFEIFDKPNFGISDFVQRANYLRAVQGELARTISQVDVVENARVMIVMPENRLVSDNQKRASASVFVRVKGNAVLPGQTINAIRFLVANAVEGLQANSVTIIDNLGNVLTENSENDSMVGMSTTQLAARKNLEQYLAKKAESLLDRVLGPGQSAVRVSAEINFDTVTKTEEKYDPDGAVLRTATINDENTDTLSSNGTGGAPGALVNASADTNNVAVPSNNSRTRKKVTNNQYEINKSTSNLVQGAGGVRRVSAAVFVAAKIEGKGAEAKPVPRSKEELEKLRRIVQSALGIQEPTDGTRKDDLTLEEMPFNNQETEVAVQMEKNVRRQFWWDLGKNAIYPAFGLVLVALFWRSFKRTPTETIPIGVPVGEANFKNGLDSLRNGTANGHGNGRFRQPTPGIVTVDVLNQLIRENPSNMTNAIRSWMTRGKTAK